MENNNKPGNARIVKVAAVQISPALYSRQGTVEKVIHKINEPGQKGVQFATFPKPAGYHFHKNK